MKENIQIAQLSNGIRVVSQKKDSDAAAFVLMAGCGSRHEADEVVGV